MGEDTSGFVSCEANAKDTGISTVSIVLKICDASELSKEELLRLMDAGGDMFRATITAKEIDGTWMLFAQNKVMSEHFKPDEFFACVEHLQEQVKLFLCPRSKELEMIADLNWYQRIIVAIFVKFMSNK